MAATTTIAVGEREDGRRLDRFLRGRFPKLPSGLVHKLLRKRQLTVNRRRARANTRLTSGDTVEVWTDLSPWAPDADRHLEIAARRRRSADFRRRFRVLLEDEHIIALDKPSGAVVHPGPSHHSGDTLLDLLAAHLPDLFAPDSEYRPAFVHRLDRGTSGVLVAAKTRAAARHLEGAFRRGEVRKTYLALVRRRPNRPRDTLRWPLEKTTTAKGVTRYRAVKSAQKDDAEGDATTLSAETRYEVVETFQARTELHSSLVRVEIGTGRTHQIRVHLAALGYPLLGDGDYGDKSANRRFRERCDLRRVFLHAAELSFEHPASGETVTLRSPLARDLDRVCDALRGRRADRE